MKIYKGKREMAADPRTIDRIVTVFNSEKGRTYFLLPEASQKLFNHSPTGFEWGYSGSGPAQLALAILLDLTGNAVESLKLHHEFKFMVIAGLAHHEWSLTEDQIRTAIGRIKARMEVPA